MSDTPETDAESCYPDSNLGECVCADFARKLERERDEAREAAERWESSSDAMERAGAEQARRADENREWALKAERERDEAQEELEEAQMCLKKAITELDLASVEIFKWERDFMTVVHGFKAVVKQLNK